MVFTWPNIGFSNAVTASALAPCNAVKLITITNFCPTICR